MRIKRKLYGEIISTQSYFFSTIFKKYSEKVAIFEEWPTSRDRESKFCSKALERKHAFVISLLKWYFKRNESGP